MSTEQNYQPEITEDLAEEKPSENKWFESIWSVLLLDIIPGVGPLHKYLIAIQEFNRYSWTNKSQEAKEYRNIARERAVVALMEAIIDLSLIGLAFPDEILTWLTHIRLLLKAPGKAKKAPIIPVEILNKIDIFGALARFLLHAKVVRSTVNTFLYGGPKAIKQEV